MSSKVQLWRTPVIAPSGVKISLLFIVTQTWGCALAASAPGRPKQAITDNKVFRIDLIMRSSLSMPNHRALGAMNARAAQPHGHGTSANSQMIRRPAVRGSRRDRSERLKIGVRWPDGSARDGCPQVQKEPAVAPSGHCPIARC